jgi:hypothetical protein
MNIALKSLTVHYAPIHITILFVCCQFLLQHDNRGVERCLVYRAYVVRVHPRQARQAAARCHGLLLDAGLYTLIVKVAYFCLRPTAK